MNGPRATQAARLAGIAAHRAALAGGARGEAAVALARAAEQSVARLCSNIRWKHQPRQLEPPSTSISRRRS